MSRWRPESPICVLGERSVVCAGASAEAPMTTRTLAWHADMPESRRAQVLRDALTELLQVHAPGRPSARLRVMVAEAWARYWVMQAPAALRSLTELRAVAQARCQQLLGGGSSWDIVADWHPGKPFLCAAVPAWLSTAVRDVCGAAVAIETPLLKLLGTPPEGFITGDTGWSCVSSARRLVILSWGRSVWSEVRTMAVDEATDEESRMSHAVQEIRRMQLRGAPSSGDAGAWWSWRRSSGEVSPHVIGRWSFTVPARQLGAADAQAFSAADALEEEAADALRAARWRGRSTRAAL